MHFKNVPVGKLKAGPEDGLAEGEFVVYPSTFTREPDAYGDVVAKGAFAETIQQWKEEGNSLPGLFGHRMDDPDFYVAYALDMGEDGHGWWVKGAFDMESPKGPHVYRLVKGRRLNQLSFAYDTLEEGAVELEGGRKANELRKLRVHEFSFVPVGANQDTSVVAVKDAVDAMRQCPGIKDGRVLAAKHIDSLRTAQEAIGAVIAAAEGEKSTAPGGNDDQEKASDAGHTKDEDAGTAGDGHPVVKSEGAARSSSVSTLAAKFNTYAAAYASGERGSR